jgi:hypothetical protein
MPQTYQEWRRLWHSVLFSLGHHETMQYAKVTHDFPLDEVFPDWHRTKWKLLSQAERIHRRMEVEQDAQTESWGIAMLDLIFDDDAEE